jgi:glyceraldehyde 3-phosphate dehydrogenase
MSYNSAISGFGRIGRLVFRRAIEQGKRIVAINQPDVPIDYLFYQLRYDTVHGKFPYEVKIIDSSTIQVKDQVIKFIGDRNAQNLKWGSLGVDLVHDCTGAYLTSEKASKHLEAGAKKVIMSAPAKDDTPLYVYGVNHETYNNKINIISNASCTTNCLAPLAKVVHENFGIEEGLMTTVHSVTATQIPVDGNAIGGKDWRAGRAAYSNIIPSSTGAAKAVGKVIPQLKGKLTGMSLRIPTVNVSAVDLTVRLTKPATYKEIVEKVREASQGSLKGVLGLTEEDLVSSDFIHDSRSSILDVKAGISLNDKFVKLIAWYDNEWGYSCRMIDLADYIMKH